MAFNFESFGTTQEVKQKKVATSSFDFNAFGSVAEPELKPESKGFLEGLRDLGGNLGAGFIKGAAETLMTPAKSLSKASETLGALETAQFATRTIPELQRQSDSLTNLYISLPYNDSEKQRVRELIKSVQGQINNISGDVSSAEKSIGSQTMERFNVLESTNTAQSVGKGFEKLTEFFIPTSAINKGVGIVNKAVDASKIGTSALAGDKVAKVASFLTKSGARTALEGLSAAGVSVAQGADEEEVKKNAEWAMIITGALTTTPVVGNMFANAAKRIYRSALKPSTAGRFGFQNADAAVETGLREGIKLTEGGLKKTTKLIDTLEARVGKAIDKAADSNKMVETAKLKAFVDDAKEHFLNIADVTESNKAFQIIDDAYEQFAKKYGEKVPVKLAQEIKVKTYNWLRGEYQKLGSASIEASKNLVRGLKEGIVDAAPEVGDINTRLKALYNFDKTLEKSVGRLQNSNLLGLDTKVLMGLATGEKSLATAILATMNSIVGSQLSKSAISIKLFRLGNLLKSLSPEMSGQLASSPEGRALLQRLSGQGLQDLAPSEVKVANAIKEWLDNPKIGLSLEDISQKAFKDSGDLTTKVLKKLEGRSTVSRQFIEDLTNSGDLKQAERDLIRKVLNESADSPLAAEARKYKTAEEFVKAQEIPKTVQVWNKSKFSNDGAYADIPVIRKEENVTLYHGGEQGQFWTSNRKYAEQFGAVKEKTGTFYQVDNGNRMTNVYVEAPTKSQLTDIWNKAQKGDINVPDFANKVKTELLPLKAEQTGQGNFGSPAYESISLPQEIRGKVANYHERVYQSPIDTNVGQIHFGGWDHKLSEQPENYFAHTRIEDMADGKTRRVIEAQSDLFQKGRLETEKASKAELGMNPRQYLEDTIRMNKEAGIKTDQKFIDSYIEKAKEFDKDMESKGLTKLEPYRNTWHERIIREEIKQAAKDGKTKLQFPTGETAMKIEGLGQSEVWSTITNRGTVANLSTDAVSLKPGMSVFRAGERGQDWIITDVLGDGKFKAVPKRTVDEMRVDIPAQNKLDETLLTSWKETFDISGKVDTSNPIYKFYEKDVQKYLTNKYGGKRVKDAQGVEWIEIDVKPEQAKMPVEAFGVVPLLGVSSDKEKQ